MGVLSTAPDALGLAALDVAGALDAAAGLAEAEAAGLAAAELAGAALAAGLALAGAVDGAALGEADGAAAPPHAAKLIAIRPVANRRELTSMCLSLRKFRIVPYGSETR